MANSSTALDSEALVSVFEERAEHLSREELEAWTQLTDEDEAILQKVTGPGAKLVTGPRGSGKSTLLRMAYFRLLESSTMVAYVNYARSMALEPLLHKRADALALFRHWLLLKIVIGLNRYCSDAQVTCPEDLRSAVRDARDAVRTLERGEVPPPSALRLSPSELVERMETWLEELGKRRAVLLLDDAAHAFSPLQQREFFEVFRELRSRHVSAKAAVYPGVTSYSPNFHVGHEAELVEAWYQPHGENYLAQMRALLTRRLPADLQRRFEGREELVDYLALASFGLPRGFLNMVANVLESSSQKPTRASAEQAVREHADQVRAVFRALNNKLPRYRNILTVAGELEAGAIRQLQAFNAPRDAESKTSMIGLDESSDATIERMISLLEYAGIFRRTTSVSRGEKGRFQRYFVHHAIMLSDGGYALGKSHTLVAAVAAMAKPPSSNFARAKPESLLGADYQNRCSLNLPACSKCGASRVSEQQLYCVQCGNELTDASVYESLLRRPIADLPLPPKKIEGILTHTSMRTIQDLLLDDEQQTVRRVPYIGPVWARRILTVAEEFVSV